MITQEWNATATIKGSISFTDQFRINDVELRSRSQGLRASCRIYADDPIKARDIAIRNINDVLDIISFLCDQHMEIKGALNLHSAGVGTADLPAGFTLRRILNENNIMEMENYNSIISDVAVSLEALNFDYKVKGNKRSSWYPQRVFDDGKKVFIQMPPSIKSSEAPIFMVVGEGGKQEIVNYRFRNSYYIIDKLFKKGILILGTDKKQTFITIVRQ